MNPEMAFALLALLADLYTQLKAAAARIAELEAQEKPS